MLGAISRAVLQNDIYSLWDGHIDLDKSAEGGGGWWGGGGGDSSSEACEKSSRIGVGKDSDCVKSVPQIMHNMAVGRRLAAKGRKIIKNRLKIGKTGLKIAKNGQNRENRLLGRS